jgi:hypothetical protein
MHYSKRDFLRIQYRWSVWARDSQVPPCEDYLYTDPDYPIVDYASWF